MIAQGRAMKKTTIAIATFALVASTLTAPATSAKERNRRPNDEKKDNTGAIVAGIAALGIGIAIATSKHGDKHKHDGDWDGNLYGDPFRPAAGVICMPRQRECYESGYFSYSWTKRIFGASGSFGGSGNSWNNDFGGSGGSWNGGGQNLDLARRVCVDQGERRGLRNIRVESVRSDGSKRARVGLLSSRSQATVSTDRWRCEYSFKNGKTEFKRL